MTSAFPAWRLSPMGASRPATRAALPGPQIRATPVDPLLPGLRLFRGFDPADPFVAGQRRDVLPGQQCCLVVLQRAFQIIREIMDHAAGDVSVVSHLALSQRSSVAATGGKPASGDSFGRGLAPPVHREGDPAKPKQHHRPGRGFGHGRTDERHVVDKGVHVEGTAA